ncbi:MAG: hydroxyacylglutathione hydrolase [Oligoflexia bacterium]|nr:hydroxyacylglutathione hydrolase [Oligoflexia bacterium]
MKIAQLLEFEDNFLYFFEDKKNAVVLDPGDARLVKEYLKRNQLKLTHIVITHHHPDHIGGVRELVEEFNVPVYGSQKDRNRIPWITNELKDGDQFSIYDESFEVLSGDGHTVGHLMYYLPKRRSLFCGDVLFSLGCGKLFEGTAEQMWTTLSRIMRLPSDTIIYCSHEYTLENAEFAVKAEPDNNELKIRINEVELLRREEKFSIPTTLGVELLTNPFLRINSKSLKETLKIDDSMPDFEKFRLVREAKDRFDRTGSF